MFSCNNSIKGITISSKKRARAEDVPVLRPNGGCDLDIILFRRSRFCVLRNSFHQEVHCGVALHKFKQQRAVRHFATPNICVVFSSTGSVTVRMPSTNVIGIGISASAV